MKIVADENIPLVKEAFGDFGTVHTVHGRQITHELLKDASILLVRSITQVSKELIEGTPIKFVATATIGIDHVDTEYLQENNIGFAYAPGSNADSVADYITSAIVLLTHKTGKRRENITVGIIGVGNVGGRVAKRLMAMGVNCLLNDPPKKRISGSDIYLPLDQVLEESDILTLHVPLSTSGEDATYHLVNHEFLSKVKQGAILINTSRGKVIDEKVLRANRDRLNALALDVWENEPGINLETMKICDIATPHIAGYSFDGKLRGTQMIYDAASAYFFRTRSWVIPEEFTSEHAGNIDVTESIDPIYDAVQNAYPIMKDDERFREILKKPKEAQEAFFDELRKKYPKRLEFTHYVVKCNKTHSKIAGILSELGFGLQNVS